jgi:hypothetical protein
VVIGGLIAGGFLVFGSNHTIWKLEKTKKDGQHFVFTAVDAPGGHAQMTVKGPKRTQKDPEDVLKGP